MLDRRKLAALHSGNPDFRRANGATKAQHNGGFIYNGHKSQERYLWSLVALAGVVGACCGTALFFLVTG